MNKKIIALVLSIAMTLSCAGAVYADVPGGSADARADESIAIAEPGERTVDPEEETRDDAAENIADPEEETRDNATENIADPEEETQGNAAENIADSEEETQDNAVENIADPEEETQDDAVENIADPKEESLADPAGNAADPDEADTSNGEIIAGDEIVPEEIVPEESVPAKAEESDSEVTSEKNAASEEVINPDMENVLPEKDPDSVAGLLAAADEKGRIESAELSGSSFVYTGEEITPAVTVFGKNELDQSVKLEEGTDYSLEFSANINAGTGHVTITGTGSYTGTLEKTFTIGKAPLGALTTEYATTIYTGEAQCPETGVTAVLGGKETVLTQDADYTLSYLNNVNAGKATVKVTGKGNFSGTLEKTFQIIPAKISSVVLESKTLDYTGKPRTQTAGTVVKCADKVLKYRRDYSVSYKNNVNAGKATMTVTGQGNYKGIINKSFTIVRSKISSVKLAYYSGTYHGKQLKPAATVYAGTRKLKKGRDYTVKYKNNINAGTAKAVVTGIGNYKGSLSQTFVIKSRAINKIRVNGIKNKYYTGKMIEQTPTVRLTLNNKNIRLKKDRDYTLSYRNNKNAGKATLIIRGKGNYRGTVKKTFRIIPGKIKGAAITGIKNKIYTGKALAQAPVVKLKIGDRTVKLKKNRDYTVSCSNNVNVGNATVIIKGKGNYKGSIKKTFRIIPRKIKEATITNVVDKIYDGSPQTQAPEVKLAIGGELVALQNGTDYTVSYKNNVNAGIGTVTIRGKGNYKSTVKVTFQILRRDLSLTPIDTLRYTYTGKSICPAIAVATMVNGERVSLLKDRDYTLSYQNNVNIGNGRIIINGIGNYQGTAAYDFWIDGPRIELSEYLVRETKRTSIYTRARAYDKAGKLLWTKDYLEGAWSGTYQPYTRKSLGYRDNVYYYSAANASVTITRGLDPLTGKVVYYHR